MAWQGTTNIYTLAGGDIVDFVVAYNDAPADQHHAALEAYIECLPPRLSIQLATAEFVEICWDSFTNKTYQVEYSSVVNTNAWMPLDIPMRGADSRTCISDAVGDQPQKFYRVLEF